jgi:hypothetical protein
MDKLLTGGDKRHIIYETKNLCKGLPDIFLIKDKTYHI